MNVELRHLRYFVAVAEELNFHRAAERLYITQPALSRQIAQLESKLGIQLFDRDRRRVELTPAGDALLVGVRDTLACLERSLTDACRAQRARWTPLDDAMPIRGVLEQQSKDGLVGMARAG